MLVEGSLFADRYRIRRRIGEGGMGAVYAADDETAGEQVALKILVDVDATSAERFRRELRTARKITHANVARVHDIGDRDGRLYITMELLDGESVRDMLDRCGQLPIEWVNWIGRQVAAGLMAAHHAGVVHRDLKPENIMVCRDGRVVLIDFGIARDVDGPSITDQGKIVGSADYMAPEQLVLGGTLGPHTDMYAFALVLFEMLDGGRAFLGEGTVQRAVARLKDPPRDITVTAPHCPPKLASLIKRALVRDIEKRPTMQELASYFVDVVDAGDRVPAPAPAASVPAPIDFGGSDPRAVSTISPRQRILAVMPFEVRSDNVRDQELGLGIAEELLDILSMTRGLEVRSNTRDQKVDPAVDTFVRGTVQIGSSSVRIAARLMDTATGKQLWAGHFDGKKSDVLQLQASMARRIAEALRLTLETIAYRDVIPEAAVDAYLKARRILRVPGYMSHEALALCDEALRIHPDFPLAVAARAMAIARTWNLPTWTSKTLELAEEAPKAAAKAREVAGDSPESHLAAAFVAIQQARFADAVESLRTTIAMAPTHAAAHEYLGRLQCEAGRAADGITEIVHATELDPSYTPSLAVVGRCYAQRGRYADADRALAKARAALDAPEVQLVELRIANWTDDRQRAWNLLTRIPEVDEPIPKFMMLFARLLAREPVLHYVEQTLDAYLAMSTSPRWRAIILQIGAEIFSRRDRALAKEKLKALGDEAFVDIEWLQHCPALNDYRETAVYKELEKKIRVRVKEMWGRTIG